MRAHAIVIGIDHYAKPEWCLAGAVRDAVSFAEWAVTAGGVDPHDLTLLLSPLAGSDAHTKLTLPQPSLPATRAAVKTVFYKYQNGAGNDADRLWFYYAGHGLAPPGSSIDAGPLVVPADVEDLDFYVNMEPIGLETFRDAMQNVLPKQQFFFVDACRDVLPIKGNRILTQQLLWDLRGIDDDSLATQAVFLATTAGQRAKEIRGHGLFGRALMAALRGLGPRLSPPLTPPLPGQSARRRLLFNDLVEFVIEAVKRGLTELTLTQASDRKAVPYAYMNRLVDNTPIAEFDPASIPKVKIGALVDPAAARKSARIEVLQWSEEQDTWIVRSTNPAPVGPPLPEVATLEMRGGTHYLRVTADGYQQTDYEILVYEDKRYPIELLPAHVTTRVPESALGSGLVVLESVPDIPLTTGTIEVSCRDREARLAIIDGSGREVDTDYEFLSVEGLKPGPYQVTAQLTSADRSQRTVTVHAGQTHRVALDVDAPPVSPTIAAALMLNQIAVEDVYAHPSENFGPVANLRLGSVLAYAAWAARWPDHPGFHRLRSIGVDPLTGLDSRGSAIQVLIGDAMERGGLLSRDCAVQLQIADEVILTTNTFEAPDGRSGIDIPLAPVQRLPLAVQGSAVLAGGPATARVEMPGFESASFALATLPGFVTVLVIAREEDGTIDVQQHLNPVDTTTPVAPGFDRPWPDDVRLVELASRALESRDRLHYNEYMALLTGKRSNPMLGIIAGYRLFRTEHAHRFRGPATPPPNTGAAGPWPLWNLVHLFGGVSDVHVLAGLYDPERREEHFDRAMKVGTPVIAEGFWTLVQWLTERSMREDMVPPVLRQSVLPGMVWTSFSDTTRAPQINALRIVTPAGRTHFGEAPDVDVTSAVARSVCRIEAGEADFLCSGALVEPQLVICPIDFAVQFGEELADGTWVLQKQIRVRFQVADTFADRFVTQIVRTLRPPSELLVGETFPPRAMLNQCWPVLLKLSEPAAAQPLIVARAAPHVGQPVAVIGFPRADARVTSGIFAQHFTGSSGEKHVMHGVVLRSPGTSWTFDYDCFTAEGTSGGPVIDVATATIVGMHVASQSSSQGRKRGVGIALTRFADHLAVRN